MSRFDVYHASDGRSYLVDLQSNYLENYTTRIVAPVVPLEVFPEPARRLNPVVRLDGRDHVVQMHFLGAVPAAALKQRVGSLDAHADEITRALDMLFQGH